MFIARVAPIVDASVYGPLPQIRGPPRPSHEPPAPSCGAPAEQRGDLTATLRRSSIAPVHPRNSLKARCRGAIPIIAALSCLVHLRKCSTQPGRLHDSKKNIAGRA